jgi:phage tail sheath protein FI
MTYGRPGVYVTETLVASTAQSVGATTAAGAVVGVFNQGPDTATLVNSFYQFTSIFGGLSPLYPATFAVKQFFENGGTELYVQRVLGVGAAAASANLPATSGTLAVITAKSKGNFGTKLSAQVTSNTGGTWNLTVFKETTVGSTTSVSIAEEYTNIVFNDVASSNYAGSVVNNSSALVTLSAIDISKTPATTVVSLTGSSLNGTTVAAADYASAIPTNGTASLSQVERPLVIFAGGAYEKFMVDATGGYLRANAITDFASVCDAVIAWARSGAGNGFAVLDTVPELSVADAITFAGGRADNSQTAVYYPNYFISDETSTSAQATRKIGPAAAVAGNYLKMDAKKGPFKAPAGIEVRINGAISLERAFSSKDLDDLNSSTSPVNAIRNLPGAGIVVMGARTLLQDGTGNRYVNIRRSLIHIEDELSRLTQFALFANNDYKLWERLRSTVTVFLNEYYNKGGLRGNSPSQAFYVKVDSENNSVNSIQNGVVNIEVGVALQYPAEFIVLNIAQITSA